MSVSESKAVVSTDVEAESGRSRKRKRPTTQRGGASSLGGDTVDARSSLSPPSFVSHPSSSADPIRGAPLEVSSLAYFRSLHSSLQSAADNGEDVQLLVSAAYSEMKGLEYRLLVNKHGSRFIESLLAHSTSTQLASLLSTTHSAAFALLSDRNASHPMQRLMDRLPQMLLDETRAGQQENVDSLSASVLAFCQSLSEPLSTEQFTAVSQSQLSSPPSSHWPLLLLQEQGSFAVRSLARLMSGSTDMASGADRGRGHDSLSVRSAVTGPPPSVSHVSFLRPVLAALVDSVVGLKEADRIELSFHATAGPALSELLHTLSAHPHYHTLLQSMVLTLLLTPMPSPAAADEGELAAAISVSSSGVAHAAQLIRHRVGSHLFEHMLRATRHIASPSGGTHITFNTLVRDILQGELAELATHSTGNHVLQTALALCTHSDRVFIKRACSTMGAMFQQLIESNRVGVIWRLFQASAFVSQKRRDRLFEQLKQSLHTPESSTLLHALLTLHPTLNTGDHTTATTVGAVDTDENGAKQGSQTNASALSRALSDKSATALSSSARVSYLGSLVVQSLLSVPLSDTSLSHAVVSLSAADLYRLAVDGSGGPLLECILRVHSAVGFSHPLSTQQRLVDALLPRVTELATSASGSYVVERMYAASDVGRKRAIAESLAKDEKRLKHSKPATMLMRRCRVQQIKTSDKVSQTLTISQSFTLRLYQHPH